MEKLFVKVVAGCYKTEKAVRNVIAYVISVKCDDVINDVISEKCDKATVKYYNCRGLPKERKKAATRLIKIQKAYGKASGRRAYHLMISFPDAYDDCNVIKIIAERIADEIFEKGYQLVYGIHEDTDNLHIHVVVSSVNFITGNKIHISDEDFMQMREAILKEVNIVMKEYGFPQMIFKKE